MIVVGKLRGTNKPHAPIDDIRGFEKFFDNGYKFLRCAALFLKLLRSKLHIKTLRSSQRDPPPSHGCNFTAFDVTMRSIDSLNRELVPNRLFSIAICGQSYSPC